MSTQQETFNLNSMRILGVAIVIFSIIQISVASAAYDFTSWQVGSWWAGTLSFITGILAIISINRGVVTAGFALSGISILLCISGVVYTGVMYDAIRRLDFCLNQYSGETYGNAEHYPEAFQCADDNPQTCLCVDGRRENICFLFNLGSADNCGQILTKLPALLLTSLIFVVVTLLLLITYSMLTCISLWGQAIPPTAAHHINPVGPVVIAVATPAGQPVPVKHVPVTVNEV